MFNKHAFIESVKNGEYITIGYVRKSHSNESKSVRLRLLENLTAILVDPCRCREIYVTLGSIQPRICETFHPGESPQPEESPLPETPPPEQLDKSRRETDLPGPISVCFFPSLCSLCSSSFTQLGHFVSTLYDTFSPFVFFDHPFFKGWIFYPPPLFRTVDTRASLSMAIACHAPSDLPLVPPFRGHAVQTRTQFLNDNFRSPAYLPLPELYLFAFLPEPVLTRKYIQRSCRTNGLQRYVA